jgi:ABC-type tungstate transport system substrate-binding protein
MLTKILQVSGDFPTVLFSIVLFILLSNYMYGMIGEKSHLFHLLVGFQILGRDQHFPCSYGS